MNFDWILRNIFRLKFLDIPCDDGSVYLRRYYIYRGRFRPHVYLHHIFQSDSDRGLHDHPWAFSSFILKGQYQELVPLGQVKGCDEIVAIKQDDGVGRCAVLLHPWLSTYKRKATDLHRLVLDSPCWTLILTGPREREWGFQLKSGWVPWQNFKDALLAAMGMDQ